MPHYDHLCKSCNQEFEDFYSIKADPPTICPLCSKEGGVVRLVSGGMGRGIVPLTGHELKEKLKADGQELKRAAMTDQNLLANLVGPSFNEKQTKFEKQMAERPRIQTSKKSQR